MSVSLVLMACGPTMRTPLANRVYPTAAVTITQRQPLARRRPSGTSRKVTASPARARDPPQSAAREPASSAVRSGPGPPSNRTQRLYDSLTIDTAVVMPMPLSSQPIG